MTEFVIKNNGYIQAIDLNIGDILKVDNCFYIIKGVNRDTLYTNISLKKESNINKSNHINLSFSNNDYVEVYKYILSTVFKLS